MGYPLSSTNRDTERERVSATILILAERPEDQRLLKQPAEQETLLQRLRVRYAAVEVVVELVELSG
jgi:hypothetical protein